MSDQAEGDQRELEAIQGRLADTRQLIGELEALIGELPAIYERKFAQQLQPLLEQERLLRQQNLVLRDQVQGALPAAASRRLLAPEPPHPAAPGQTMAASAPGQAPGRRPLPYRLALGAAVAALGAFGLVQRLMAPASPQRNPAPLGATQPTPQAPAAAGPIQASAPGSPAQAAGPARAKELLVIARGPSWIELRDPQGRKVYGALLKGRQRFNLGAGLSLKAGRPERVQVQLGGGPAQPLPPGKWWTWHRFKAPGA